MSVGGPNEVTWTVTNIFLILTNLAFLLNAVPCIKAKKYLAAFFFSGIMVASSLYHMCKWGEEDRKGVGGYCIPGMSFEMLYAMDFFFSQMTVPIVTGFFINPKNAIINLEEKYPKIIKVHKYKEQRGTITYKPVGYTLASNTSLTTTTTTTTTTTRTTTRTTTTATTTEDSWVLLLCSSPQSLSSPSKGNGVLGVVGISDCANLSRDTNIFPVDNNSNYDDHPTSYTIDNITENFVEPGKSRKLVQIILQDFEDGELNECKIAFLDGHYYSNVTGKNKERLDHLESAYLLFHVLAISLSIKLVGPSIQNVTLPLTLFNALVVLLLLVISYGTELRSYLNKKLQEQRDSPVCSWRLHILLTCLPKKTALGTNVIKSLEWSSGIQTIKRRFYNDNNNNNNNRIGERRERVLYTNVSTYKKRMVLLACLIGLCAVILFATQNVQPHHIYPGTHGLWHVLGGLGIFLILTYVL